MGQTSSRSSPGERHRIRTTREERPASSSVETQSSRSSHRRRSLFFPTSPTPSPSSPSHDQLPPRRSTTRRRHRLQRSFTSTIPNVFSREFQTSSSQAPSRQPRPARPSSPISEAASEHALPHLQVPDLDLNFNDISPNSDPSHESPPRHPPVRRPHHAGIPRRFSSLSPDRGGFRNLTASLRRRRTNVNRGDDHAAILARLLSMTAAATAASLMGINPDNAVGDFQDTTGVVDDDGTFDGFLQALRGGRLGDALGRSEGIPGVETNVSDHNPPSLDFFRMFRFGSSAQNRRNQEASRGANHANMASTQDGLANSDTSTTGDRMIPVLIVGIRSLNSDREETEQADNMPSFLDALSNIPGSVGGSPNDSGAGVLRQPRSSLGLGHRRRASMGGLNLFSANRDSSRRSSRATDLGGPRTDNRASTLETPPGPFPPPTTPSSPPVSAFSSGVSTPTGRASPSISSGYGIPRSRRESVSAGTGLPVLEPTVEEEPMVRTRPSRRRMSESDFGRFGAGSSRRNGAYLEPLEPSTQPGEGSRSWIIYILGGNYPENHPILTAPTLFSDNPTYEDMLLLSSLLGPVKPPVASQQDLAAAGGMFRIQTIDRLLVAASVDSDEVITLNTSEKCLVCLCDYEIGEDARRLAKCEHLFHRECIDQWLTTGRNSCPLCRGQGVDEQGSRTQNGGEAGPSEIRPVSPH